MKPKLRYSAQPGKKMFIMRKKFCITQILDFVLKQNSREKRVFIEILQKITPIQQKSNFAGKSGKFRNIKKNLYEIGTLELFKIVWNAFYVPDAFKD